MKTIIYIVSLFFSIAAIAQDGYNQNEEVYKNIKEKINNLDSAAARSFSDKIASSAKTNYTYFKTTVSEDGKKCTFHYIPEGETKETIDKNNSGLYVYFDVKENKQFKFSQVYGAFSDLFPTWKREFLTTTTEERVLDYEDRDVIDRKNDVDIRFEKNHSGWYIQNNSY